MVVYPPNNAFLHQAAPMVFLAGSIEMGKARHWQQEMEAFFETNYPHMIVANPRRDNWDSSWEQSIQHSLFSEQVNWELDHLEQSQVVVFYFDETTKSPVTLLELGKILEHTDTKKVFVCCPYGFWRKGNVDIVCSRKNVVVYDDINALKQGILERIAKTS